MDTEAVGIAASLLGAGRKTKDDVIDLSAGIVLKAKTGDRVNKGEPLAVLYASDEHLFAAAEDKFLSALDISQEKAEEHKLIYS
jgi:pyrimidine-nucleoside phosphorylase